MAVKSGIPTTINGVQVGATDFSEFTVGAGLPAGITGLSANFTPLTVGIKDTPVSPSFTEEGKYFEIETPITFNAPWAFVIDAFNGLIEQGELLARISCNFSTTQNRRCMGPGMSLQLNPGISGAGSGFQDAFSSGDVEVAGGRFVNGGVGTIDFFSISQALQEDDWIWLRIRKTNNAGIPSNDDWTVTAWYGDIEDEPAAPDGVTLNNSDGTPRGLFGIGCTYFSPGSSFTQRCAFLSYSENPDAVPPPIPPLGAATVWTPFPEVFARNAPKPAIINGEIEFDVRVLAPLGLNDGDTVVTWPDASGQGNDAVRDGVTTPEFVKDGWGFGVDAVRLLDGEFFNFSGEPEFVGTEATFFLVFQATDLSLGCAVMGSEFGSSPPPRLYNLHVDIDGTIFFNKEFTPRLVNSAPGVIEEGGRYIVTGRMSILEGMIIRVNGIEVASNDSNDAKSPTLSWPGAGIGRTRDITFPGGEFGLDKLIVWISGHSLAASDAQILQMESFLSNLFDVPFGTEWTDQPEVSPGTVWANTP